MTYFLTHLRLIPGYKKLHQSAFSMASGLRRRRKSPKEKLRNFCASARSKLEEGELYEGLQILKAVTKRGIFKIDPESAAVVVADVAAFGDAQEYDLFVARTFLEILWRGEGVEAADSFLRAAVKCLKKEEKDETPFLIRFCARLGEALRLPDNVKLIGVLERVYGPALNRDPELLTLLHEVIDRKANVSSTE
eukprot:g1416.t1